MSASLQEASFPNDEPVKASSFLVVVFVDERLTDQCTAAVRAPISITEHRRTDGENGQTMWTGSQHFAVFEGEIRKWAFAVIACSVSRMPVEQCPPA